jgi:hypothetical protein
MMAVWLAISLLYAPAPVLVTEEVFTHPFSHWAVIGAVGTRRPY